MIGPLLALLSLLSAAPPVATDAPAAFRIVGYLPEYRAAEFDPAALVGLTDLIVFSAEPTRDGRLDLRRLDRLPRERLLAFKTRQRVRLLLCVGGWERSSHFAAVAADIERRRRFIDDAVRVCLERRLDGLDLDWEHPKTPAEQTRYGDLLQGLRDAFRPHGLQLSVTIAGWQKLSRQALQAVDAVQVMSYDHRGRHSTLEAALADVKAVSALGVPRERIVLGMPFYGRHVTKPGLSFGYRQIVARHRPAADNDEVESIYFNGPEMIRRKTEHALQTGLGGVMVWELGQDAPGSASLLRVIHETVQKARR